MSDEEKTNFLAAGISSALPQKGTTPPRPTVVRRPKERDVEEEQTSENATLQERKDAPGPPETQPTEDQEHTLETTPASMMTDEQVRTLLTQMLSANAATQSENRAKRQKIDLAELLIQTIASYEGSEVIKEQFSKLANLQKRKINQGLFAPEALFTIYNSASVQMKLAGKKATMSDLMAKALIAYVPEIIKELEQE
jgi:YesN/AraC family two-component response regulator